MDMKVIERLAEKARRQERKRIAGVLLRDTDLSRGKVAHLVGMVIEDVQALTRGGRRK